MTISVASFSRKEEYFPSQLIILYNLNHSSCILGLLKHITENTHIYCLIYNYKILNAVLLPHARSYFSWEVNPGLTVTILAGLTGTVPVSPGVSQLAPVIIDHCVPLNPCGYWHVTKIYVCLAQLTFVRPPLDCMYWGWTQCGCCLVSTH